MLKIAVDRIQDKPLILNIDEPIETFPVLARMQDDGLCAFTGSVTGTITAQKEYDHLRVSGSVSVPGTCTCSRCLASFETAITSAFTIFYRKGTQVEVAEEDEIELGEEDLVSATYAGEEIDLTHEIEEQVAMDVPLKPLCSETCKGLCPACGTDLNRSQCTCKKEEFNLKFSALKDFKASR